MLWFELTCSLWIISFTWLTRCWFLTWFDFLATTVLVWNCYIWLCKNVFLYCEKNRLRPFEDLFELAMILIVFCLCSAVELLMPVSWISDHFGVELLWPVESLAVVVVNFGHFDLWNYLLPAFTSFPDDVDLVEPACYVCITPYIHVVSLAHCFMYFGSGLIWFCKWSLNYLFEFIVYALTSLESGSNVYAHMSVASLDVLAFFDIACTCCFLGSYELLLIISLIWLHLFPCWSVSIVWLHLICVHVAYSLNCVALSSCSLHFCTCSFVLHQVHV